ncbi:uncharacterized protein [Temnothorax longispinosus]|uniref:uncharacterized protein n=1 Tax=Temnothorax longispinosus TaxID=300112 RepID=UPI003A998515
MDIPKANSHIKDSFQLVNILNNSRIDDNYTLISLDVVSLFTNVPSDLAIDSICNRWEHLSKNCDIPKDEFIIAVRLILDSTYFRFNNKVYKQNFGSPMGSPLSPDLADLVLQDIETRAMRMFNFHIPFFFRYVDDIAMAIPNDTVDFTLQTFNSFHPRLQFTIEIGDNKLNFLDTTIINNNGLIEFDWYHKPTFSGRYLNYYSCHPSSQKRGTIIGLIDRAFLLSHPRFHRKNLELIISILLNNDYPLDLIFNTIHERLKSLFYKQTKKQNSDDVDDASFKKWFTVPFFPSFSAKFKDIFRGSDTHLAYYSVNKLNKFIKVQKNALPFYQNSNVVYKIFCRDCDASYVGQTCRQLKTRISEHRSHINRNSSSHSVITDHRIHNDHEFDWDNVKILDRERYYHKRLISEVLHIKQQRHGLNLQSDTECLHHAYLPIINNI